jgi:hypothetical protein
LTGNPFWSFKEFLTITRSVPPFILAHQVGFSSEVGGTLHIEPNDTPRAGDESLVWFALVRKGGQPLPLSSCDCQLAVYAKPRQPGDRAIATPVLTPLSAEGYVNIPAATLVFPEVGQYELVMIGQPAGGETFTPFELTYEVLVATAVQSPAPLAEVSTPASTPLSTTKPPGPAVETPPGVGLLTRSDFMIALLLGIVLGIGVIYVFIRSRAGK